VCRGKRVRKLAEDLPTRTEGFANGVREGKETEDHDGRPAH
jgi:hypothetical protein